eukprot:5846470-Pyramimonas_sp.AAC.2
MRGGGGGTGAGDSMRRPRDENSVRVTNLSEDTREPDLQVNEWRTAAAAARPRTRLTPERNADRRACTHTPNGAGEPTLSCMITSCARDVPRRRRRPRQFDRLVGGLSIAAMVLPTIGQARPVSGEVKSKGGLRGSGDSQRAKGVSFSATGSALVDWRLAHARPARVTS